MTTASDAPSRRPPHTFGVLAALPGELGVLRSEAAVHAQRHGFELRETSIDAGRARILATVAGVGKVAAAGAAGALLAEGIDALLVVGTCGGLRQADEVGDLVHARVAIQWDLAVRDGRFLHADEGLRRAWRGVCAGADGAFLTADRPAIRVLERLRRARAMRGFAEGTVVADMETAGAAAVAERAGVPWAALRVVSDRRPRWSDLVRAGQRRGASFEEGYRLHAATPAASVPELCRAVVSH